ncbi:hypothetical protein HYS99_01245 [Candidatus Giovannonibacteria bacterium]|nr:hypothetical protein [Candidatus Giovannonibacteria bacterium]
MRKLDEREKREIKKISEAIKKTVEKSIKNFAEIRNISVEEARSVLKIKFVD